jgi:hypothetical protein
MNLFHNVGSLRGGLKHFPNILLHVIAAYGLLMTGARAAEKGKDTMKTEKFEWKPILGDWYDYKDATGQRWDARDIATSQGKVAATFLLRRADEETTEHWRAVLFADGKKMLPLPYNIGGKSKIELYWYDAIGDEGPFVRLTDRWGEYLVDLRRKTTANMVRRKGVTFLGELRPGDDKKSGIAFSDYGTRLQATAAGGQPAMVVIGPLATEKGRLYGEIRSDGR